VGPHKSIQQLQVRVILAVAAYLRNHHPLDRLSSLSAHGPVSLEHCTDALVGSEDQPAVVGEVSEEELERGVEKERVPGFRV
jgi:hypothetical protein